MEGNSKKPKEEKDDELEDKLTVYDDNNEPIDANPTVIRVNSTVNRLGANNENKEVPQQGLLLEGSNEPLEPKKNHSMKRLKRITMIWVVVGVIIILFVVSSVLFFGGKENNVSLEFDKSTYNQGDAVKVTLIGEDAKRAYINVKGDKGEFDLVECKKLSDKTKIFECNFILDEETNGRGNSSKIIVSCIDKKIIAEYRTMNDKTISNSADFEYKKKGEYAPCLNDCDCSSGNCFKNMCKPKGYECDSDIDCESNKYCVVNDHKCISKGVLGDFCFEDNMCQTNKCLNKQCVSKNWECATNENCDEGSICNKVHKCVPKPPSEQQLKQYHP